MAQSFNHIEVSLGEAERVKHGKKWTHNDYELHKKNGYNIDEHMTHLNQVLVSAGTTNEETLINNYFENRMIELNKEKKARITKWNNEHRGKINPKTNKTYHMKSVDKREMYSVGEYANKGKRKAPYTSFMSHINKGNARNKSSDKKHRSTVLQQFVVGFGSTEQWYTQKMDSRFFYMKELKGMPQVDKNNNILRDKNGRLVRAKSDPERQKIVAESFTENYVKPYLNRFKKENPHLHVVQAAVHFDETNPHLQFTVLPHRDGSEYGGIGSIAFSDAIKADHPHSAEYWKSHNPISELYQNEHLAIRKELENTKPFNPKSSAKNLIMLPGKRPGSHASMRANKLHELNQKQREVEQQQQKLDNDKTKFEDYKTAFAKQKDLDNKEKAELINTSIATIKNIDKTHKVPQKLLNENETPAEIQTETGEKQHRNQGLQWLMKTANDLWTKTKKKAKKWFEVKDDNETKTTQINDEYAKFGGYLKILRPDLVNYANSQRLDVDDYLNGIVNGTNYDYQTRATGLDVVTNSIMNATTNRLQMLQQQQQQQQQYRHARDDYFKNEFNNNFANNFGDNASKTNDNNDYDNDNDGPDLDL